MATERFKNVSIEAGLTTELTVVTTGVVTADVNKDGYVDIFLTTIASQEKSRKSIKHYLRIYFT